MGLITHGLIFIRYFTESRWYLSSKYRFLKKAICGFPPPQQYCSVQIAAQLLNREICRFREREFRLFCGLRPLIDFSQSEGQNGQRIESFSRYHYHQTSTFDTLAASYANSTGFSKVLTLQCIIPIYLRYVQNSRHSRAKFQRISLNVSFPYTASRSRSRSDQLPVFLHLLHHSFIPNHSLSHSLMIKLKISFCGAFSDSS